MTSKRIAQTNQQQKSEKPQVSGILQRAAVHSVLQAEVQSTEDKEAQPLGNSALSKNFSRVPISTTKPQQIMTKLMVGAVVQQKNTPASVQSGEGKAIQRHEISEVSSESIGTSGVQNENKTGLPDRLKTGIENLSGYSMDDVRVHYNSELPTQLQAHAYAQGTDIHIASGQEKHLLHEAWHVVQQKQGRVKPTIQEKGVQINADEGLEREADVMRAKVTQIISDPNIIAGRNENANNSLGNKNDRTVARIHKNKQLKKTENDSTNQRIIQKVRFRNVGNTNNPQDNNDLFEAYRHHDIEILYEHQQSILTELQEEREQVNVNNARMHIENITKQIELIQSHAINSAQKGQKTIVVSGNARLDDIIIGWSPIAKAGKTPEPNTFKMTPSVVGEYRISQNDAEGKTLTFLEALIKSKLPKFSYGKHLDINIQGSYGPCDGCKERIKLFVQRITKLIQNTHILVEPLSMSVKVLYVNPPLSKVRGGNLNTVYGWNSDEIRKYDDIEPIERFTHIEKFIIKPKE